MLSVAPVRSASGAASYFAKDDYYTAEGSAEASAWGGEGAAALGLSGAVGREAFDGILNGILPDGEGVGQVERRRAGIDLTFSMPKSASVMAYVAGDARVLQANITAVRNTMAWVEKNLAEGRREVDGRKAAVRTGNLVYALFQHDTSRALDPQAHIHAVIANLTRMPDGKWQALHADRIWSHNSVIGSIYHAYLRAGLEALGYQVEAKGKHGTFEIEGVPQSVLAEFSQRKQAIDAIAARLDIRSHEGRDAITLRSRDAKLDVGDREVLRRDWRDRAAALGFDGKDLAAAADARAGLDQARSITDRGYRSITAAIDSARARLGDLLSPRDPLVEPALARAARSPADARAQLAVASAVRILAEREAAWPHHTLSKTALDLGLRGVTVEAVERRIEELVHNRQLIGGTEAGRTEPLITTPEALQAEEAIIDLVERGRGLARPVLAIQDAPERLQALAERSLNAGQLAAATLILSSPDRTVVVQGVAGAGKSTMLSAVARVAASEGRVIAGLAFQNKMVADLAQGAGIETQTVAAFVHGHRRFIEERDTAAYEAARIKLAGTMLVVDESSMVSSRDMLSLHQIVAGLGIDKLVLVGDRKQLSSIEAGKAFAMIQAADGPVARMDENIRQRTDLLRTVAGLANRGAASDAIRLLGHRVVEHAEPAAAAADMWLALPPAERAATAVFASGRDARATINARIQDGLAAEGSLKGEAYRVRTVERVNFTREELRYPSSYRAGQIVEIGRGGLPEVGVSEGRYIVRRVTANGRVELSGGRRGLRFDPQKLPPNAERDRLQLLEQKSLALREGDRIRWTANDKSRGLHNAALAQVVGVGPAGVTVELSDRGRLTLAPQDPMLARIDLAYSLNMHMAQGLTTDKAITVMSSHERHLSNQRLFNVGVTRVRDELTLVVDDKAKLERQLDRNPGNKTSALEAVGRLDIDEGGDGRSGKPPRTASAVDPEASRSRLHFVDIPPPPGGGAFKPSDYQGKGEQEGKTVSLPLPERDLGLDL